MKHPIKMAGLMAAVLSNAVWAEEPALFQGDEIVVTATRTPQSLSSSLGDVSVITAAEIAKAGQSTLAELLQSQSGVEVVSNGGLGQSSSIFLRGANNAHTLVLIDGMRVQSATLGTTAIQHIPLNQIERIEILRSPASSLYGSDAIGGVIQIFTKAGTGAPRPNLSVGYGSYNTQSTSGGIAGKTNGTRYSLQAGYLTSDGFSAVGNPANRYFNPDKDGYRNANVTANLAQELAPGHELGLNVFYANAKVHYDFRSTQDDYENHRISSYAVYSRNQLRENWQSMIRVGRSTDDSVSIQDVSPLVFRTDENQFYWQNSFLTASGNVTAGIERLEQAVASTSTFVQTGRTIDSLFAGYEGSYGAHSLQVNARHDQNSQFGSRNTGLLAYGYRFTQKWRASASVGTAFKAPTFNDLYYPLDKYGSRGNPNLLSEQARNREVALHYVDQSQQISAVYFDNQVTNLITWVESPVGSYQYTPMNVGVAKLTGATLSWQRALPAQWQLNATLTSQNPRDGATGKILPGRAKEHGAVRLSRANGAWDYGGEVIFSGKRFKDTANTQPFGGYGLLNLTAGYALTKEISLKGRINNLFDKHYELVKDFNTPGANIFVSLEYHPR